MSSRPVCLQSEFQVSQRFPERPCLRKSKKKDMCCQFYIIGMAYWDFVIVRTLEVESDKIVSLSDCFAKTSLAHLRKHLRAVTREDVFVFNSV